MRTLLSVTLAVVLLAASVGAGDRPWIKRNQLVHVCTPRDVKMMARFVCSLHRRSVRSAEPYWRIPDFYDGVPSRAVKCDENSGDCATDYEQDYENKAILSGDVRTNYIKRDKEVVSAVGLTIADVRRKCCLNGCMPQDFYGACR